MSESDVTASVVVALLGTPRGQADGFDLGELDKLTGKGSWCSEMLVVCSHGKQTAMPAALQFNPIPKGSFPK